MEKGELIDLDECVLGALNLFTREDLPKLDIKFKRPLVVGSVNGHYTGEIIFSDRAAVFADESDYMEKINANNVDGAVLISASGGKDSPAIAQNLRKRGIRTVLFTNNPSAHAIKFVDDFIVFPKNPEPYTYNTSTYFGMILSKTHERAEQIISELKKMEKKIPKDLKKYDSYFFILPNEFHGAREMFLTKYDELFGPMISARVFTEGQVRHAKTIVNSDKELFVGLGVENKLFGKNRINFNFSKMNYGMILAAGYYFIGKVQRQNKPYFKENIGKYVERASKMFGEKIEVIAK